MALRLHTTATSARLVEAIVVAFNSGGVWHAFAPGMDIWSSGEGLQQALNGVAEGIAATFSLMSGEGELDNYLDARGFIRDGEALRVPENIWLPRVEEILRDIREEGLAGEPVEGGLAREKCRIHTLEISLPAHGG